MRKLLAVILLLTASVGADVVKNICSSGADYTTVTAWETAYSISVTGLGLVAGDLCAEAFAENVTISGATNVSTTDRRAIRAQSGAENKGRESAGARITPAAGNGVDILEQYFEIQDVALVTPGQPMVQQQQRIIARRVLFKTTGNFRGANAYGGAKFYSCIFRFAGSAATGDGQNGINIFNSGSDPIDVYNCTFYGGFWRNVRNNLAGTEVRVVNTIMVDAVDQNYVISAGTGSGSNNYSDDATGPSTDSYLSQSSNPGFVDKAGGNVHVLNTATAVLGKGKDMSGTYTRDVDAETIATWMIGADYIAAAAPASSGGRCCIRIRFLRR